MNRALSGKVHYGPPNYQLQHILYCKIQSNINSKVVRNALNFLSTSLFHSRDIWSCIGCNKKDNIIIEKCKCDISIENKNNETISHIILKLYSTMDDHITFDCKRISEIITKRTTRQIIFSFTENHIIIEE